MTSYYKDEYGEYDDKDLWEQARGLVPSLTPAEELLASLSSEERTLVETMKDDYLRIKAANLAYPLIMTPDWFLADGYHRLVLALLSERPVAVVRLRSMPPVRKPEVP